MKSITLRSIATTLPWMRSRTSRVYGPGERGARVLHALHAIRNEHDPTLAYRYCCGSGQCRPRRQSGWNASPCLHDGGPRRDDGRARDLPVLKDLMVDMELVIAKIARICPAPDAELPEREVIAAIKTAPRLHRVSLLRLGLPGAQVTEFAGPDGAPGGGCASPSIPRLR